MTTSIAQLEVLRTQADCIAAIDKNKLAEVVKNETVRDMVMCAANLARKCSVGLLTFCVTAQPVKILVSPCGTLFVSKLVKDESGHIVDFEITSNPNKAYEADVSWVDENAKHFKNGAGCFSGITKSQACENVCRKNVASTICLIEAIIKAGQTDLESLEQIQSTWYHGEFFKPKNASLAEFK